MLYIIVYDHSSLIVNFSYPRKNLTACNKSASKQVVNNL